MRTFFRASVSAFTAFILLITGLPANAATAPSGVPLGGSVLVTSSSGSVVELAGNDVTVAGAILEVRDWNSDEDGATPSAPAGWTALGSPMVVDLEGRNGAALDDAPHAFATSADPTSTEIVPGLAFSVPLDAGTLLAVAPETISLFRLADDTAEWVEVPSGYDGATSTLRGHHDRPGVFVVMAKPAVDTGNPHVVIDVPNDADAAFWDGRRVFELESTYGIATLAEQMLEESCNVDVTLTRGGEDRWVNTDLRVTRSDAADADLVLTLQAYAGDGLPSGDENGGGAFTAALNDASSGFAETLAQEIAAYTGRVTATADPTPSLAPFGATALKAAQVDLFELDNPFDHAVYSERPDLYAVALANAVAMELADLEGSGTANCVATIEPGGGSGGSSSQLIYLHNGVWFNAADYPADFQDGRWVGDNTSHGIWMDRNRRIVAEYDGTWHVVQWPAQGVAGTVVIAATWQFDRPMGYPEWHASLKQSDVVQFWNGVGGLSVGLNLGPIEHVMPVAEPWWGRYQRGPVYSWFEFEVTENWTRYLFVQGTDGWYAPSNGAELFNPLDAPPSQEVMERLAELGYADYHFLGLDPVDLASGNFILTEDLFALPGLGDQEIMAVLNYNSADHRRSAVGIGWNMPYSARVQKYDNGSVMFTGDDGRAVFFESNGSGGLIRAVREHLAVRVLDGAIIVSRPDGTVMHFDVDEDTGLGVLATVTDRQGNTTTLEYGEPGPDHDEYLVSPPLVSITDEAGQVVSATTNTRGYITSLALPDGRTWNLAYDAEGHLTSIEDALGRTRAFTYTVDGRMDTITGADGVVEVTNAYDEDGRVVAQTDGVGSTRSLGYTDEGTTVMTDALGNVSTIRHNDVGQALSQTDALGHTTDNVYDADFNPATSTDANGAVHATTYDQAGRVATYLTPLGEEISYSYNASGDLVGFTAPGPDGEPATTTYVVSDAGRVVETHLPNGTVLAASYNQNGDAVSFTDALGNTTTYAYDSRGNVTSTTDPLGAVTRHEYDLANRPVAVTDALGNTTTFAWDAADNLVSSVDARGAVTSYVYDVNDSLVSETNALGDSTTFEYDANLLLLAVNFPDGTREQRAYDAEYRLVSVTNTDGTEISLAYDALGRPTEFTDEIGAVWQTEYDAVGNPIAEVAPDGTRTEASYDAVGRVTSVTDALGNVASTSYNPMGLVSLQTDALGYATSYEYNVIGQLTRMVEPGGAASTLTYDAAGNLLSMTDPGGFTTSFEYDAASRRVAIVDATGARTTFEYDALGRVTATVDARGARSETSYDELGNPTAWTDALGGVTTTEYDLLGRVTRSVDALGATTQVAYDSAGRITELTVPDGGVETFAYDARGSMTRHTDALGFETSIAYDALGREVSMTDASGAVWLTEYDSTGNVVGVVDPAGARTSYEYDALGRTIASTSPGGAVATATYDANGNRVGLTEPLGHQWQLTYDERGHLVRQVDPAGGVTAVSRNALGDPIQVTDPRGAATQYDYDPLGRIVQVTDPEGYAESYSYDAVGNTIARVDARGGVTAYEYDLLGRVLSVTDPTGATTSHTYDAAGNLVRSVDATGVASTATFDAAGRITSTTENAQPGLPSSASVNVVTVLEYDARGLMTRITDPRGHATQYVYDELGRVASMTNPLGETSSTEYDATGRVVRTIAPNGQATSFAYNADGHLSRATYPDQVVEFSYDLAGNRTAMTDGLGTSTWDYDWAGRVLAETDSVGNTVLREYDEAGNETSVSYGDGRTVTRVFDGRGLATSQSDASGSTAFEYEPGGGVSAIERPSGVTTAIERDAMGRITSIDHVGSASAGSSASFDYSYDEMGLVQTRTSSASSQTRTTTYEHDELGRLVGSQAGDYLATYSWDASSNLVGETRSDDLSTNKPGDGWSEVRTVNAANRLVEIVATPVSGQANKAETTTFSYDASGNRVSAVTTAPQGKNKVKTIADTTYSYDGRNLLAAVSGDAPASWVRDGLGRALTVTEDGSTRSRAYDGWTLVRDGETALTSAPFGGVLSETTGTAAVDVLFDAQLSSVATATDGQISADLALFGDFGEVLDGDALDTVSGFTGRTTSGGLLDFASRSFDPGSRVWVQQDSYAGVVGRSASLNRYTYVEGAPETFVDVLGYFRSADAFDAYVATLDGSVGKPWTTSALEFVDNHQGDIIGGLVTVGCTVVTAGAGVLGCVALGSTISGSLNYYADTPAEDRSVSGFLTAVTDRVAFDVVVTVATLGLAAVAAPIVGAVVRTVAAPIRSGVTTVIRTASQKITTAATVTRNATTAVGNTVRTGVQSVSNAGRTAVQRVTNVVDDRVAAIRLNPDAGQINLGGFTRSSVSQSARPQAGAIAYRPLDSLGRPTGATARLTPDMIGTGSPAARRIVPPGFEGGAAGHARGHLLGNQLGGSGTDPRNLVTLFQNPANSPVMRGFENQVRVAVESGQVVDLVVTPIYRGSGLVPAGITMQAKGSVDLDLFVTILNRGN